MSTGRSEDVYGLRGQDLESNFSWREPRTSAQRMWEKKRIEMYEVKVYSRLHTDFTTEPVLHIKSER